MSQRTSAAPSTAWMRKKQSQILHSAVKRFVQDDSELSEVGAKQYSAPNLYFPESAALTRPSFFNGAPVR